MENRSHALVAGLFTLFLGVAVLLSVWWIGGKHETSRDYVVVTQQNVTGLSLQGQVRYRGIRVGKVQAIELWTRVMCATYSFASA
jgi:phospholipid/cholesterol/gamma-HCH transport system substrate-binding protein